VQKAVEDLNYAPRHQKASMSDVNPLQSKDVLMLFLGDERSITTLPVVASMILGVRRAIDAAEADLAIVEVPGADEVPSVMSRKSFAGVIVKGFGGDVATAAHPDLVARLRGLPTVWILGRSGQWGDVVQSNDFMIGTMAAEHLLLHGHRRLAFLDPRPTHGMSASRRALEQPSIQSHDVGRFSASRRRQSSFTFFAEQAGAEVKAYLGEPGSWPFPSPLVDRTEMVQGLVDRLLAEREPPTAIFAPFDSIGATVARALAARGLQAGRDISLMSCNNEQQLFMGIHPTLTTIDIHAEEIGRRAVDQLAWRLANRLQPRCEEVAIEPTLVEGESVATL
jgi:DNA-binding LacI/PurR family transcriptional regulator